MMDLKQPWYRTARDYRRPGRATEAALDRSDASALADLQMHWDEAYAIGLDGDIWSARFHGATDELRAHTAGELRELIRTDYWYRQRAGSTRDISPRTGTAEDTAGASYEEAAEGAGSDPGDDTADDDTADDDRVDDTVDDTATGIRGAEALSRADFAGIRGEHMSI